MRAENLPIFAPPEVGQPQSGKGTIVGRLVDDRTNTPIGGMTVIIGEKEPVVGGEGTDGFVVTMHENASPRGVADQNGYFVIENLDPDSYGLILFSPLGAKMLSDLESDEAIYVDVVPNEVTVVGDLPFVFP